MDNLALGVLGGIMGAALFDAVKHLIEVRIESKLTPEQAIEKENRQLVAAMVAPFMKMGSNDLSITDEELERTKKDFDKPIDLNAAKSTSADHSDLTDTSEALKSFGKVGIVENSKTDLGFKVIK